MALAKYFAKDLLAINRLINTNHSELTDRLNSVVISVAFDDNCLDTFEGNCGIDLLLRLLSRLYPKLKIIDLSGKSEDKVNYYSTLAKKINSQIELVSSSADEDVLIVVGKTQKEVSTKGLKIYFGSNNWIAKYSLNSIQEFGNSENPFGAGLSACFVASNVFRQIFKDFLRFNDLDTSFDLSSYSLNLNIHPDNNPPFKEIEFNKIAIAGIGAIGNGVVWALSKITTLKGEIHLIDCEKVSLSNLQRYILLAESDESAVKVEIAKQFFKQKDLRIITYQGNWDNYLKASENWDINCVAVGIDNANDRIGIQSSLPKSIFNAFTEMESIAITRHTDFVNQSCLACSYIPVKKQKDFINEIADNCNIPQNAEIVKVYYNLNAPVGHQISGLNQSLLSIIAVANGISVENLDHFKDMTVNQFYSDYVCGGIILTVSKENSAIKNVDAPLAFQSAMAGILLGAELVKYAANIGINQEQRTDIYHLSPISDQNPFHRLIEKDATGRCICRDTDFINRYIEKWVV